MHQNPKLCTSTKIGGRQAKLTKYISILSLLMCVAQWGTCGREGMCLAIDMDSTDIPSRQQKMLISG